MEINAKARRNFPFAPLLTGKISKIKMKITLFKKNLAKNHITY
jgi:hypothetical protein